MPLSDVTTLIRAANQRTSVTLPDGAVGTLVYISPDSLKAKVRVGRRHVRVSSDIIIINKS